MPKSLLSLPIASATPAAPRSVLAGALHSTEVDELVDATYALSGAHWWYAGAHSVGRSDLAAELRRLAIRRPPTSIALDDMVASESGSFHVSEETPSADFLADGAPKSWDAMMKSARRQLDNARLQREAAWERWERDEAEVDDTRFGEDFDLAEVLDAGDFEFNADDARDLDDTRWEIPGTPLDPYFCTCPGVVEDRETINERTRYLHFDGETMAMVNDYDALAEALLAEAKFHGLMRQELELAGLHKELGQEADEKRCRRVALKYGELFCAWHSQAEFAVKQRMAPCFLVTRKNIERITSSDESAWRAHGKAKRAERFASIEHALLRASQVIDRRKPLCRSALAFLRRGYDALVETPNRASFRARGARVSAGERVLSSGRDYFLDRTQADRLRDHRAHLLNKYSTLALGEASLREGGAAFLRSLKPLAKGTLGGSVGTRLRRSSDLPDTGAGTPNLFGNLGVVNTLGLTSHVLRSHSNVTVTVVVPISTPRNYRGALDGSASTFEVRSTRFGMPVDAGRVGDATPAPTADAWRILHPTKPATTVEAVAPAPAPTAPVERPRRRVKVLLPSLLHKQA